MLAYYLFSPRVTRDVPYGRKPRQLLDLYVPPSAGPDAPAPVVVFVTGARMACALFGGGLRCACVTQQTDSSRMHNRIFLAPSKHTPHPQTSNHQQQNHLIETNKKGGAWTIGYKAWGAMLARRLCDAGALVACLDYRNFPQADALAMLEDVNAGISWALRRASRYGGDPARIALVGQSAGGQLALLALLNQAAQAATGEAVLGAAPVWHPSDVAAFVGVSGAYDLEGLAEHMHRCALHALFVCVFWWWLDCRHHNTHHPQTTHP
jgi:acetyl esterase/lipase